jgi:nucleotide-binding universal stress UspA family protein
MSAPVLFPVDVTGCAFEVAARLAPMARELGAEVVLLVVDRLPVGVEAGAHLPDGHTAMEALDADVRAQLGVLQEVFADEGVAVRSLIRHGDVTEAILRVCAEVHPRFIAMGTHGRQGLQRALLGSVAEAVIRRAEVPVMTMRALAEQPDRGPSAVLSGLAAEAMG